MTARDAYAFRKLKDAGAVLIFGSDRQAPTPPATSEPGGRLYRGGDPPDAEGVSRRGWFPNQRLTIEEALEAYTRARPGRLSRRIRRGPSRPQVGRRRRLHTDLVKVGKTSPADLLKAKVLYTIVGGKAVYEAKGPAGGR
jgi:predicted amidohydrolase YtcJ